jgi:hypothetical protein
MAEDWVKFHAELTQGAKRALSRATRFIFMEISLKSRKKKGTLDLRHDVPLVDAIHDVLGGGARERREVADAVPRLTTAADGDQPMLIVLEGPGWRRLVTPSWGAYNYVDDSKERAQRYRDKKKTDAINALGDNASGSVVTRDDRDASRSGSSRASRNVTALDQKRSEEIRDPVQAQDLRAGARVGEGDGKKQTIADEVAAIASAIRPVDDVCARSGGADGLAKLLHVAVAVRRPGVDYPLVARLACVQIQGELTNGKHRDNRGLANLVRSAFVRLLENPTELAAARGESKFAQEGPGTGGDDFLEHEAAEMERTLRENERHRRGEGAPAPTLPRGMSPLGDLVKAPKPAA